MKPPPFGSDLAPLDTDASIHDRVASLIGRAARRQVWFLFVDESDGQLPLLLPIEDHPSLPDRDDASRFGALLTEVAEGSDARGAIIVIERFADASLTPSDLAWARVLNEAARESPLTLRGILLSHSRGVRWIAPDDYLFASRPEE